MPTDPACIFCKIAAAQIPSHKIYEDDTLFAFLDIAPLVTGHTLIIPKSHYPTIMETPPELLAAITAKLPVLSRAILAATGTHACHLLINNGPDAMQTVPHLHFHILPRKPADSFCIPWNASKLEKTAASALAESIKSALAS